MMETLKTLLRKIGGMSKPEKMPCYGWSIPAAHCHVGSKLRLLPTSPCWDCYALKGFYMFRNVKAALENRYQILMHALAHTAAADEYVNTFSEILNRRRVSWTKASGMDHRFFRWFDSGDLQSALHLELINRIAYHVPRVKFWLPTQERRIVNGATLQPNLLVRISSPRVDHAPGFTGWHSSSMVYTDALPSNVERCTAPDRSGHCGPCRRCWTHKAQIIGYHLH